MKWQEFIPTDAVSIASCETSGVIIPNSFVAIINNALSIKRTQLLTDQILQRKTN